MNRTGRIRWRGAVALAMTLAAAAGCGESTGSTDPDATTMRGYAVLDEPVASGAIEIQDASGRTLQRTDEGPLVNGTFAIPLRAEARAVADAGGVLRVSVTAPATAGEPARTLVRLAGGEEAKGCVLRLDGVSTVVADYAAATGRASNSADVATATTAVDEALALGGSTRHVCGGAPTSAFDHAVFLAAASDAGGFDAFAASVAAAIAAGESPRFTGLSAGGLGGVASFVAENLAKGVVSGIASKGIGFVIDGILGPDKDSLTLDEIKSMVADNGTQIKQLQQAVSDLSSQLDELRDEIANLIKGTAYEQRASALQKEINELGTLYSQLGWLASAYTASTEAERDAFATTNAHFVETLLSDIQSNALTILTDIRTEMLGSSEFKGLVSAWADLNAAGTGYPYLIANSYLSRAAPHLQYYVAAETTALNLLVELGHHTGGALGQQIAQGAVDAYSSAVDLERKALTGGYVIGDAGKQGYVVDVLPSDDVAVVLDDLQPQWVISRKPVCAAGVAVTTDGAPCMTYVTPEGTAAKKVQSVVTYLADTFSLAGLTGGWQVPSAYTWSSLGSSFPKEPDLKKAFIGIGLEIPDDAIIDYWVNVQDPNFPAGYLKVYNFVDRKAVPTNGTNPDVYTDGARALAAHRIPSSWLYIP